MLQKHAGLAHLLPQFPHSRASPSRQAWLLLVGKVTGWTALWLLTAKAAPIPRCSHPCLAQGPSLTSQLIPTDVEQHIPGGRWPHSWVQGTHTGLGCPEGGGEPSAPSPNTGLAQPPLPEHLDNHHSGRDVSISQLHTPPAPSSCCPTAQPPPVGTDGPGDRAGGHQAATSVPQSPPGPSCQGPAGETGALWGETWNFRDPSESIPSYTSHLLLQPCFSRGWDEHGHRGPGGKSTAELAGQQQQH